MLAINLLPWRIELREKNKRQFIRWISSLVITIVCILFINREMVIFLLQQKKQQVEKLQQQLVTIEPDIKKLLQMEQQKIQLNQVARLANQLTQQRLKTNNFLNLIEQAIPNGIKIKNNKMGRKTMEYCWLCPTAPTHYFVYPRIRKKTF